jgi:catechol 2,3-dioxygenase-like lactoylglutathione lyase family enzyme
MTRPALVPELYVTDLARSLQFYVDVLGFRIEYRRPESGFAAISLRGSHFMLEEGHSGDAATDEEFEAGSWRSADLVYPLGRGVSFEVVVDDVNALYARVMAAGYPVKLGLRERFYGVGAERVGLRQFLVMDPDGYLIRLAEQVRGGGRGTP